VCGVALGPGRVRCRLGRRADVAAAAAGSDRFAILVARRGSRRRLGRSARRLWRAGHALCNSAEVSGCCGNRSQFGSTRSAPDLRRFESSSSAQSGTAYPSVERQGVPTPAGEVVALRQDVRVARTRPLPVDRLTWHTAADVHVDTGQSCRTRRAADGCWRNSSPTPVSVLRGTSTGAPSSAPGSWKVISTRPLLRGGLGPSSHTACAVVRAPVRPSHVRNGRSAVALIHCRCRSFPSSRRSDDKRSRTGRTTSCSGAQS
jgi:hypothetical protein